MRHKIQFPVASCQLCSGSLIRREGCPGSRRFSETGGPHYLVLPDFLAVFFGADFFFAADFFAFGSAACSSDAAAFTFFGFASFFGRSGALKLFPPKAISAIRTEVNAWRCPRSFLYCFLRL